MSEWTHMPATDPQTDADSLVTFSLRGPAGIVLPKLVADTWPAMT